MSVKVQITARNFTYLDKIYGTNGVYDVSEKIGRWIVKNAKGIVTEGTLPDEEDPDLAGINDGHFLSMVRRNALKIAEIISEEIQAKKEVDLSEVKMTADLTVDKSSEHNTTTDNSEGIVTDADTTSSDDSKLSDANDTSSDGINLPEGFPGREILIKAGIKDVTEIPDSKQALMELEGMTKRLANQIGVKLSQE